MTLNWDGWFEQILSREQGAGGYSLVKHFGPHLEALGRDRVYEFIEDFPAPKVMDMMTELKEGEREYPEIQSAVIKYMLEGRYPPRTLEEKMTDDFLYEYLWALKDEELDDLKRRIKEDERAWTSRNLPSKKNPYPRLKKALLHNDERLRWMKEGIDGH